MTSLVIQGINPVLPVIIILLVFLASLFISWWSYGYLNTIQPFKKWSLIGLRATSLSLLVFLLFNPYIIDEQTDVHNPQIAVYLDNSESLSVERGEYSGLEAYLELIDQLGEVLNENLDFRYFTFDSDVRQLSEIDLSGSLTNLHNVVEQIIDTEDQFDASIIVSDGIITQGRNPAFIAQSSNKPIITIGIGDTTEVKDISLSIVDYSTTVYTNTLSDFTVSVQQQGYNLSDADVQFSIDGELSETQSVEFSSETSSHRVEFRTQFEDPGFYELEFNVPPKEDEYTARNNIARLNIEVLDDKSQILSIAFQIHPDVGSIRRLIASDSQYELTSSTQTLNNQFAGEDPLQLNEYYDLIIVHGVPEPNSNISRWLSERDEPILFLSTPGSFNQRALGELTDIKPLRYTSVATPLDVTVGVPDENLSHPLLELETRGLNRFPTLKTFRGNFSLSSNLSQILLKADFQSAQTDIPILVIEELPNRRIAEINAFDWFRYERSQNIEAVNFFKSLFSNLISWASTPSDNRNLVIEPTKDNFSENEEIQLRATLVNERNEPEPNAIVEVVVFTNSDEQRIFRMNNIRGGIYTTTIGNYPEGLYEVHGSAVLNNRTLGEAETRVSVSRSSIELLDTKRNDQLLRQIATLSGGLFIDSIDHDLINDYLDQNNISQQTEETISRFLFIYQSPFWFLIILVLLSSEWLIRRSVSLP